MTASSEGHTDVVQTLIEAEAQINTQEEVCCSYHQKTHCTTHSAVQLLSYNDINMMAFWGHPLLLNFLPFLFNFQFFPNSEDNIQKCKD